MPSFFSVPIDAGLCTYIDCRDHLTLDEVADLNEILAVRYENERRAYEEAERRARQKTR